MEDHEIVELYWQRKEEAVTETAANMICSCQGSVIRGRVRTQLPLSLFAFATVSHLLSRFLTIV